MRNKIFTLLFLLVVVSLNTAALELTPITSISITNNLKLPPNAEILNGSRIFSRKDGAFLFQTTAPWGSVALVVNTNRVAYISKSSENVTSIKTNVLQSFFENGELKIVQQEKSVFVVRKTRPEIALRTLSDQFLIDYNEIVTNTSINLRKISSKENVLLTNYNTLIRTGYFSKIYLNGQSSQHLALVDSWKFKVGENSFNLFNDTDFEMNQKVVIVLKQDGDKLLFYRLTDAELSPSFRTITLGSVQKESIIANVSNPDETIISVQSSTNLVEWQTLKTIQNDEFTQILVPISKQQEFLRIVE